MVLAEYTEFTGNFPAIAAQCLQKLPSSNNKFTYSCDHHTFNFLVEDGYGCRRVLNVRSYMLKGLMSMLVAGCHSLKSARFDATFRSFSEDPKEKIEFMRGFGSLPLRSFLYQQTNVVALEVSISTLLSVISLILIPLMSATAITRQRPAFHCNIRSLEYLETLIIGEF